MKIEDNIIARVSGTVTYKNDKETLFKIESNLPGGKYPERTTVWGAAEKVNVGDRVLVQGILTARKGSYMKQDMEILTVEVSLNKPEIIEIEAGVAPAADEPWASIPVSDGGFPNEVPF